MYIYERFCLIYFLLMVQNATTAKSLVDTVFKDRQHSIQNQGEEAANYRGLSSDSLYSHPLTRDVSKVNFQKNYDDFPLETHLQNKQELRYNLNNHFLQKKSVGHENAKDSSAYGVVYRNGRPWGLLEPLPQTYVYQAMSDDLEEKRFLPARNIPENVEQRYNSPERLDQYIAKRNVRYADEKYPDILTNFKIDTRMTEIANGGHVSKRKPGGYSSKSDLTDRDLASVAESLEGDFKDLSKRDTSTESTSKSSKEVKTRGTSKINMSDKKMNELKSTINKIQNAGPAENLDKLERNLKTVLSEMGLLEGTSLEERDTSASAGDEIKVEHNDKTQDDLRQKREEVPKSVQTAKRDQLSLLEEPKAKTSDTEKCGQGEERSAKEKQSNVEENKKLDNGAKKCGEGKRDLPKPADGGTNGESEDPARNKRTPEKSQIVKDLEKSGELALTGNQSPLASTATETAEVVVKRDDTSSVSARDDTSPSLASEKEKRSNSGNDHDYEQRVEKDIQAKIDAIREQVKREIDSLDTNDDKKAGSKDDESQRKKRDVTINLLNQENGSLDPNKAEVADLEPLIRRRRKRQVNNPQVDYSDFDEDGNYDDGGTVEVSNAEEKISSELTSKQSSEDKVNQRSAEQDNREAKNKITPIIITTRKKRANAGLSDSNADSFPYESEEAVEEESGTLDHNAFDKSAADSLAKRESADESPYLNGDIDDEYHSSESDDDFDSNRFERFSPNEFPYDSKDSHNLYAKRYVSNINADEFPNANSYLFEESFDRQKRKDFEDEDSRDNVANPDSHYSKRSPDSNVNIEEGTDNSFENDGDSSNLRNYQQNNRMDLEENSRQQRKNGVLRQTYAIPYRKKRYLNKHVMRNDLTEASDNFSRRKRNFQGSNGQSKSAQPQSIGDLSDSDIFGSLSQNSLNSEDHARRKLTLDNKKQIRQTNEENEDSSVIKENAIDQNIKQTQESSRGKRDNPGTKSENNAEGNDDQSVADLSDAFGALPQSYEGELVRFKRVKRKNVKRMDSNV